jgi:hypothetical protein
MDSSSFRASVQEGALLIRSFKAVAASLYAISFVTGVAMVRGVYIPLLSVLCLWASVAEQLPQGEEAELRWRAKHRLLCRLRFPL